MPQMEAVPFPKSTNAEIMDAIRHVSGNDYQQRIPSATKAGVQDSFNAMWDYKPARNQFIDALVNLIGAQMIRYNVFTNPLAVFKVGELNYGETIEEVAIGLLNAYHYSHDREYLEKDIFGKEQNEVQSRFHKVNREDYYKLTVRRQDLKRAFYNEGGLQKFVAGLVSQVTTSDQWDEFLLMSRLFRIYYDDNGFFKQHTGDISSLTATASDSKMFIKQVRSMSDTLPFMSRDYNAAHMPVVTDKSKLLMITTPEAQANMDVDALAAAFNMGSSEIASRTIVLPKKYLNVPGFQAVLTTEDFFVCADNLIETDQANNPVGLHTNYFFHHWETISASPFVPAILYTTEESTPIIINDEPVVGISDITVKDIANTVVTTLERGDVYVVNAVADLEGDDDLENGTGVTLSVEGRMSTRTRVSQSGVLRVGYDDKATKLTLVAKATGDNTFERRKDYNLTGDLVQGSIGQTVDTDTTTISNSRLPGITPATGGPVGTDLTVNNGSWDTEGLTFAVQWTRDGANITGATTHEYTTVTADGGHTVSAVVTASKTGFTDKPATAKGVAITTVS